MFLQIVIAVKQFFPLPTYDDLHSLCQFSIAQRYVTQHSDIYKLFVNKAIAGLSLTVTIKGHI